MRKGTNLLWYKKIYEISLLKFLLFAFSCVEIHDDKHLTRFDVCNIYRNLEIGIPFCYGKNGYKVCQGSKVVSSYKLTIYIKIWIEIKCRRI